MNYSQLSSARCGGAPLINVTLGPGRLRTQLRFLGAGQNSLVILRMFCPPHFAKAFLKCLPFGVFQPYTLLCLTTIIPANSRFIRETYEFSTFLMSHT